MIFNDLEVVIDIVAIGSAFVTILVAVCTYHSSRKKARAETIMEMFSNYLYFSSIVNSNVAEIEKLGKIAVGEDNAIKSSLAIMGRTHILSPRIFEELDAFELKALAFCQADRNMTQSVLDVVTKLRIWFQNTNALYELLVDGKTKEYLELYKNCINCGQEGNIYQFTAEVFYEHMKDELKRLGLLKEK